MNGYIENCRESILPLSAAEYLTDAFDEWSFTGAVRDRKMNGECELCGYHPLRWHFLIKSEKTDETLWVGSECIKRFAEHRAEERGEDPEQAREEARDALRDAQREYEVENVLDSLRELWKADEDFRDVIENIAAVIEKHEGVSPKQAKLINWRAQENNIPLRTDFLKISLRKLRHKDQMKQMPDWQIQQFWDAFSNSQQNRANERGWCDINES